MNMIPTFDLCSFILLSFFLAATYFRRMTRGKINQYYIILLIICLLTCSFDILAIFLDARHDPAFAALQFTAHSVYLFLHNITLPLYFLYIIAQTDTFHRFGRVSAEIWFLLVPAVGYGAVMALNAFNGMVFTLDNGIYVRGWFMNVLYIISALWSLLCIIYLIIYHRLFTPAVLVGLLSTFPLMAVAVVVQMLDHNIRIEMFAITVGMLFIATFIQRPEAVIDFNTGINKFNAYAVDMKRGFHNKKKFDVILINIANFLSIQEILNYESANQLLRMIADTISKITKRSKAAVELYYLDKGRFRVFVDNRSRDRSDYLAESINAALKPKLPLNGMEIDLVAYVCIVKCPEEIHDFDTLIEFGKDLSKFRFSGKVLYAAQMLDHSKYDLMSSLDKIINEAILNNRFEVYYQPIYSVSEKCYRSAEALVRLYDEHYGFISPAIFIPATERTGTIITIGRFVFEEVCKFIASEEFKNSGLDYIEVNLSLMQCMQGGLAGDLLSIMKKYGVRPEQINLEITESADSETQSIIAENITELLKAGITFSLDDFGTGYSNMQRMASMPLKIVKLDKTFVNMNDNPKLLIVVQNTVKMLKAMNMEIVVEGVETAELVERFTLLNCEYIQGFYYSRPLPKDDFVDFLRKNNTLSPVTVE